nr:hypothetical protein [uncultured Dysosmobacter sp.]
MRRIVCLVMVCVSIFNCFCMSAGAVDIAASENGAFVVMRASGSFNMSVGAYERTAANTTFPLAARETVHIRANYAPEDASMDFGLIDPDGIFHYINVTTGTIDVTIEVPENGNYTLAIRNNSGNTVKVSGFVNY